METGGGGIIQLRNILDFSNGNNVCNYCLDKNLVCQSDVMDCNWIHSNIGNRLQVLLQKKEGRFIWQSLFKTMSKCPRSNTFQYFLTKVTIIHISISVVCILTLFKEVVPYILLLPNFGRLIDIYFNATKL